MSADRDRFWARVGAVLTGTAVAQAIPILGSLVLARLYAPAAFGLFAAWLGLAQLAAVAATGRYENALALEGDGEPRRTAALATLAVVAGAGTLILVASLLVLTVGGIAGVPLAMLLLFAPTAVAIATSQVALAWAAGEGRFGAMSGMRIAQAAAVTGTQIVAGALWPSAGALAVAQLVGLLLGLAWALRALPLRSGAFPARARMAAFWHARRRFPLLSLPADGINTAAAQLPLLVVGIRFGAEAAGCLALTLRVLAAPVGLLGSAVLDVFKRDSAAAFRERGECRAIFDRTFCVLATGSAVVALALAVTAEPLFAAAFGERWRLAGTMALWLLPLFALRFVASPLSYLFYVAGKQHVDLVWQGLLLAMTLVTLWASADARGALIAYSAGYSAMYGVYLFLSCRYSRGCT
ncbi:MAG: oligosaccharide flippase family protein [Rubrivivax sp.]|nr:oligosaccharide flippase family protein [Rubrivivax sp.]MBP6465570.1 oligosaccharide flippase family protein [Rubrivivax sp.]